MRHLRLDNQLTGHQNRPVTTGNARILGTWAAVAVALALSGCSNDEPGCSANDQCASGEACRDRQCVTLQMMPMQDAGRRDASTGSDGAVEISDAGSADAFMGGGACEFNDDGILTAGELPLGLNVVGRFIEAQPDGGVAVDLTGQRDDGGLVHWDFSNAAAGDRSVTITAVPLTDLWFGPHFLDGQYAVPLDGSGENYGIFKRSDEHIQLLGVASRDPDVTRLKYDPPVTIIQFPLQAGQTFTSDTTTTGTFQHNPFYTSTDSYRMAVDARGTVVTPAGTFAVLRVQIRQSVTIPIAVFPFSLTYNYIQYSFMAACYSQVVHVASKQNEAELMFNQAASLRRLGLPE